MYKYYLIINYKYIATTNCITIEYNLKNGHHIKLYIQ